MSDPPSARTFISYSRHDGKAFAADLRQRLLKENLSIWQDILALEGGRDWWSQIEKVLRSKDLDHLVLVVTPGALASPVVRREIRLARQEGKTVSPVRGHGIEDLNALPRWLGHVYDLAIPEQAALLVRVLHGPSTQKRVPMMAPEPPADFVERPTEFGALKQQLLDKKGDAVAITAALRGAGGFGKTTLAQALAHDADIQDAYFDGVLWVELGESPDNLLSMISDLIEILAGERPGLENVNSAAAKLGEALGERRILLVVDDAWRAPDLRPFLHGGPHCTRLITTRNDHVLPDKTVRQPVDAMRDNEALQLLAGGLPEDQVAGLLPQFASLAKRLGEWAQLLKIVNGFLRNRAVKNHQPLAQALAGVKRRLDDKGFGAFDAGKKEERTKTIAYTIQISLDLLSADKQDRFGELAVFPEEVDIPAGIVARLWAETGGFGADDTEDLLSELADLSLLQSFDLERGVARLHDNVREFLREQAGANGLIDLNKSLLRAIEDVPRAAQQSPFIPAQAGIQGGILAPNNLGSKNWVPASAGTNGDRGDTDAPTRRYYYLWLPYHLAAAGERKKLDALLTDPGWLTAKLAETKNPQSLIADFDQYGAGETQSLIGRTLRLAAGILARDERQLVPQLLGRLMGIQGAGMASFLLAARGDLVRPALLAERANLTPPGAEAARLEGHTGLVTALCLLPDGRLASGSYDNTIRLWDLARGVESARLEVDAPLLCLTALPDGRLVAGDQLGRLHWLRIVD